MDEHICVPHTGADGVDTLAVHLGLLGFDFSATEPPQLVDYLRALGDRYRDATALDRK